MVNEKENNIIEIINKAFKNVARENGTSLHEAEVIDYYGSEIEKAEARKLDKDTHWSEIADKDIEYFSSALSFMNPIGWRYHIPAYMIWTIKYAKKSDSLTSDNTIDSLDFQVIDIPIETLPNMTALNLLKNFIEVSR
ncbi:MAG: hypothetical protein GY869_23815 [Planctomycetes bacterium]|nr:hypothetical protein [Planctomycetota bacterium]